MADGKQIPLKEAIIFGAFLSMSIGVAMITTAFFVVYQDNFHQKTLQAVFPAYRSYFFFMIYQWLLGFNVLVWNRYNINYREIFKFNQHYSKVNGIFKRAAVFSVVWLVCLMLTVIISSHPNKYLFRLSIQDYLPLVPWVCWIVYLIFPSKDKCNGQGRLFVYKGLWKDIFFFAYKRYHPSYTILVSSAASSFWTNSTLS